METKDENSYRSILKGTSLFGGVQVFQILINLVRGKFVAMFLGPDGMGVNGLMSNASNTLSTFSSLGLNLAFVREVAEHKDDRERLRTVVRVALQAARATALLGAFVCVLLSPFLSRVTFGSDAYTWQFLLLAVAVYLTVEGQGKLCMLQGMHKVRTISATTLIGAATGLLVGVPLYYFFGTRGIVPALIAFALATWICYTVGVARAVPDNHVRFSWREHKPILRRMALLGFTLLAANLITQTCTYVINIFIRSHGDLANVGLFNAANSITNQYAGVVFTAMSLDYFPRLAAAAADKVKMHRVVNRQLEIVALIVAPAVALLIATAPAVIRLLLTSEFLGITELMRWMGLGVMLKATAYPLGYIAFAKNNRRLFFWLEGVACNALYFGCAMGFYAAFGLIGLGYAMVTEQGICVLIYYLVNRRVYGYTFSRRALAAVGTAITIGVAAFACSLISDAVWAYVAMGAVAVGSIALSFRRLRAVIKS